jgi:thioredoxin 1
MTHSLIFNNYLSLRAQMGKSAFIEVNFINWEQHVNNGLILIDFWAPWCSACVSQDKIYNEIAITFHDKLRIGKVDVNDNRVLANKFGVINIPHLILFKDGIQIMQLPGIESKEYLISQIKKHLI